MRLLSGLTLTAAVCTTLACDPVDETEQPPGVPISEPISSDFRHGSDGAGCAHSFIDEAWTYSWRGDRLQSAVLVLADGRVADDQAFTYDAAGRLITWTRGPEDQPSEVHLIRDDAGALTQWTHAALGDGLTVTISREDDTVTLHLAGQMFVGFETPLLIDLDRIDADLPVLSPRFDLIFGQLERRAVAQDDELVWDVLNAIDATQRIEQSASGTATVIDVDGDGAPDVIEQVTRAGDATTTTIDYAIDGQIEVTIDAGPGRSERVEIDAAGASTRTVTHVDPRHIFIDRLDEEGRIADRSSLFFDAQGARIMKYEDDNADGVPNWRKRYINDPETGLRHFDETDSGADGSVERRREYEYNAEGRVRQAGLRLIESGDCDRAW